MTYRFSAAGAYLIISSRQEAKLLKVKENSTAPDRIFILPLDVTDFDAIPAAAEKAMQFQGKVDILINNAGLSQRALAQDTKLDVDQKIMDVNYFGSVAITKAVLPYMLARKKGHIVSITSVMGKMGVSYRSAYCASKHAMQGFFDALRAELYSSNIQVTNICPGYVRTNVTINALRGDGSTNNQMAESTAGGYSPEEFAKKALRAIGKRQKEAYIAKPRELLGIYLTRFVPTFFFRIIRKEKLH